ncbi:MAG: SH3 domain-containing protein [Opitutus sp.]|nr:SH3 domain-containing protein [Opitutus sp.]
MADSGESSGLRPGIEQRRHARLDLLRQAAGHEDFRVSEGQMGRLSATIKVFCLVIGKKAPSCKAMFGQTSSCNVTRLSIRRAAALADSGASLAMAAVLLPCLAVAADDQSGLPLPRFVTTRSNPINVRVGPGTNYDVAWVYVKAGTPVEIIQEFDTWRKIRDADGSEGWLHQNLLRAGGAGLVAPWKAADETRSLSPA